MLSGGIFDYDGKRERLEEVDKELEDPGVWSDQERAQRLGRERSSLESVVAALDRIRTGLDDAHDLYELAATEDDPETIADIDEELAGIQSNVERLEFQRMFSGEVDRHNAFVCRYSSRLGRNRSAGLGGDAFENVSTLG